MIVNIVLLILKQQTDTKRNSWCDLVFDYLKCIINYEYNMKSSL